jgi:hypothetical protein
MSGSVAHQAEPDTLPWVAVDRCRQLDALELVRTFFTASRARLRRAGPQPAQGSRTETRSAGERERQIRRVSDHQCQASAGKWAGKVRARGVGLPRPLCAGARRGRRAERRAVAPVPVGRWLLADTQVSGIAHSRSVRVTRPTMPTILSPGKIIASGPERRIVRAGSLQRQGHPEIVSNRFAENNLRDPPLERWSLCQPSGPGGEGQARGQPETRGEPP